jgi:hypothetical protein
MKTSYGKIDMGWAALLTALILPAGCTGDDTTEPGNAGGADATVEAAAKDATSEDGRASMGGGGAAGSGGSGTGTGGTGGGGTIEAGFDGASLDATTDVSQTDASSDGPGEAEAGPPLTIGQYQNAVAVAWCTRISECCQLDPTHFDRERCINSNTTGLGPDGVLRYYQQYAGVFPTTLAFDPIQAARCVELQRNRSCTDANAVERRLIYATCMSAAEGTLTQGRSGCRTSLECTGGLFCQRPADGGLGSCVPLAGANQPCNDPSANSDQCTYLGIFSAGSQHCSTFAASGGTCVDPIPTGSSTTCNGNQECQGICSTISVTCRDTQTYPSPSTCTRYTIISDGGEGG